MPTAPITTVPEVLLATIPASVFVPPTRAAGIITNKKSVVQRERYLFLTFDARGLTLAVSRSEMDMTHTIPANVAPAYADDPLTIGVDAATLNGYMGLMEGDITMFMQDTSLVLRSDRTRVALPTLDGDARATINPAGLAPRLRIAAGQLSLAIRLGSMTVDPAEHTVFGGMRLGIQGDHLAVMAFARAHGVTTLSVPTRWHDGAFEMLIRRSPLMVLNDILAGLPDETDVTLSLTPDGGRYRLEVGDRVVNGVTMDGKYPDLASEIAKWKVLGTCEVDGQELRRMLNAIRMNWSGGDDKLPPRAVITFFRSYLNVGSVQQEGTEMRLPITWTGTPIQVQINARQIAKSLADMPSDVVTLGITDRQFVVLTDPAFPTFYHAAAPFEGTMKVVEEATHEPQYRRAA